MAVTAAAIPLAPAMRPGALRRALRHAGNLAAVALSALLLLFVGATVAGSITHHHSEQVITGSMVPVIPVGSLVVTEQVGVASLHTGDILVFAKPTNTAEVIVHRIVQVQTAADGSILLRTKGDANLAADPWVIKQGPQGLGDRAVYIVPALGTAIAVARDLLILLIPALLIVALFAWARRRVVAIARAEP